ncbi:MAG: MlaE family lipid ABC transporter permease subunit [Planctomycetota bacterium]|nr:MlaE family lipid ABC transporter permease subunit [Planctomycetota bacterium]
MASIDFQKLDKGKFKLAITGRLDAETTGRLWPQAVRKLAEAKPQALVIDASKIDYCDGAGMALLLQLKHIQERRDHQVRIEGLRPELRQLLDMFDPGPISKPKTGHGPFGRIVVHVGRVTVGLFTEMRALVTFVGELSAKLLQTSFSPLSLRWKDTFLIAEKSGANAVGITVLLGFLIGVILAFQSAIAMSKFGAEVYVADLVVITIFRELGPLITAFVLAARSGSAFAAEIGTMKVNEEIDALTTMGLDPVKFLVIPRVLAATFVTPLLTMFNNLFGVLGAGFVMISIGFAPITILHRIQNAADLTDLFSGLIKTFVFGALIAGIGCLRGLQTKTGASAVGDSATSAVVTSIIAIVVVDGVFAVVYYFLGI